MQYLNRHPESIEGKWAAPDISVKFQIEYVQGHDPQLEAAVKAVAKSIRPVFD